MLFTAFKTFNLLLLSLALSQLNLVCSIDETTNSQVNSVRASSKASFLNPRLQGLSEIGLQYEKDLTHELWNNKIKLEDVGNERVSRLSKQRQEAESKYKDRQKRMSYFKHRYREFKQEGKEHMSFA
jgi:predicted nuclease with TOPRIM domain